MKKLFTVLILSLSLYSCTENFSNGERIGMIVQFSKTGYWFKSYEGHLNLTQTGMNSSQAFYFSVDNDNEPPKLVAQLDSAAQYGWKVKLKYHETMGKNLFHNRGQTSHFITSLEILDKAPMQSIFGNNKNANDVTSLRGIVRDTIYLVIYKNQ